MAVLVSLTLSWWAPMLTLCLWSCLLTKPRLT